MSSLGTKRGPIPQDVFRQHRWTVDKMHQLSHKDLVEMGILYVFRAPRPPSEGCPCPKVRGLFRAPPQTHRHDTP